MAKFFEQAIVIGKKGGGLGALEGSGSGWKSTHNQTEGRPDSRGSLGTALPQTCREHDPSLTTLHLGDSDVTVLQPLVVHMHVDMISNAVFSFRNADHVCTVQWS